MSRRAAFFDLDKTLVRANTGTMYVRWRVREREMGMRELVTASWWSLQYMLGVLDAERMVHAALTTLVGKEEAAFRDDCARWVKGEVLSHITDAAKRELAARRDEGYVCALLTSTSPYVADPVADHLGVEHVLCSRLEVVDGRFTGALDSPLCFGHGKVGVARTWAEEHGIDVSRSVFYTDSVTDLPMLEKVGEARVINPDPRLERVARKRGWAIDSWR